MNEGDKNRADEKGEARSIYNPIMIKINESVTAEVEEASPQPKVVQAVAKVDPFLSKHISPYKLPILTKLLKRTIKIEQLEKHKREQRKLEG